MDSRSRSILAAASLVLLVAFVAPLWRITLEAPQYPEGLGLSIMLDTVKGQKPHDLNNINNLNHYIGMKRIEPESIPELRLMPWVIGTLIALGLVAAAAGRRALLTTWTALFVVVAIAGLVDFWLWEYDYGHNLDLEHAAIKVPGMSYQPPLIGSKRLLNFTAHSWPGPGGWAVMVSLAAGLLLTWRAWGHRGPGPAIRRSVAKVVSRFRDSGRSTVGAVALLVALGASACRPGPEPIAYGEDQDTYCRMTISDPRFAGEIVTKTGRVLKFDSIECMGRYYASGATAREDVHSIWLNLFDEPGTLLRSDSVAIVHGPGIASPMGGGFAAIRPGRPGVLPVEGPEMTWDELVERLAGSRGAMPRGRGHVMEDTLALVRGRLSERIAAAGAGDTIRVGSGVYIEPTLVIDRPLVLLGEGWPVLDGGEGDHELVRIEADDVELRGFVLRNVSRSFMEDRAAIRVEGRARCRIAGNRLERTFFGIYLARASGCEIRDNVIESDARRETDGGNGIHSWYSRGLAITGNTIRGHRDGIYLEFTEDSEVLGNVSEHNRRYGLHFMFSDRCRYEDNRFSDNSAGVAVMYAEDVEMRRNTFRRAWGSSSYGLLLKEIKHATVEDNEFVGNSVALFVEGTDRSGFRGNTFSGNGWALKLMANATTNVFSANVFLSNSFDVATNSRSSTSLFEGNYWDRYAGYDLDRNGIGDVPFHPVRLFSLLVERNEPLLVLQRSLLVDALDLAERVLPALTPEALVDARPLIRIPSA